MTSQWHWGYISRVPNYRTHWLCLLTSSIFEGTITICISASSEQIPFLAWQTLVYALPWKVGRVQETGREGSEMLPQGKTGRQIPREPSFRLRNTTLHVALHIQDLSFCWRIMVKVPGTVSTVTFQNHVKTQGLAGRQCSRTQTEGFLSSFTYSQQLSLCGPIFLGCFDPQAPRYSGESWRWWYLN